MNTSEYDAFGPWIYQVRSAEEVPRLFRGFELDLESTRLVLKVPREIERRNATPSMDLYDRLLIAGDDGLTVLTRVGSVYSESRIDYSSIVIIEDSVSLLDGRLTVFTSDGRRLVIPYNATSRSLVARLVDLLRVESHANTSGGQRCFDFAALPTPGRDELGLDDVSIPSEYRELLRLEPDLEYFGGYGRTRLDPIGGRLTHALHRLMPAVLHGAIVCGTQDELQLLSRREWLVRSRVPVLSSARTVVRLSTVDSVTAQKHPAYSGADVVTVRAGAALLGLITPPDSIVERTLLSIARKR